LARKILLADDSVTAQNMGRRILSDAGYDVTTVNNGSAALKKIAESKPDLIVLDVYMPGYGGLEVCQRLREAPETARIPVLLTVGKLEPFKADEARRVRADGFIVKPFEASELLTALTKLEDKIVPQSQPAKPSRFAKALAGADEAAGNKEFGDSETGWKNRLSIPPPPSKRRDSEPDEAPDTAASVLETSKATDPPEDKPLEMKSGLEEALLSSLPQDVTEEEIAAIKAAAAAFSAPGNESTPRMRRSTDRVEAPIPEPVAQAELPSESVARENTSESISAESSPIAQATAGDGSAIGAEIPAETATSSKIVSEPANEGDHEVTAALALLAPTNGHAASVDGEVDTLGTASREPVPVTMAFAGASEEFSGPRWIAESVPLETDEATLILEHEMEKAYAAFAAADGGRMSFVGLPDELHASFQIAEISAVNSEPALAAVEASNSHGSETTPQEPAVNVEAAAMEPEPTTADAPAIVEAVSETSAYAAAASASAADATPSVMAESSEIASLPEAHGESELAAAWANWKQIRESVIGSQIDGSQIDSSQLSAQIADTVAEVKQDTAEAKSDAQHADSPATGEEASEIANIVDSVLADLKPKLMAEIAKKMNKEKRK
jgi:CheY-like chemotaxis protein